ncbi:Bug family tripartite tricarboxylate transporter substrate binding protein [Belnapia moabensis]|uniref:Bug family tripartite tricarboxylate transporter substrate binding protein n=1 Tax=Belnapia moabensis TaxID=365533 RepID=UPI0005BDF235|nr:tripartite tricarboxylate transporter substrate binding protein [Belnapia moabensis]
MRRLALALLLMLTGPALAQEFPIPGRPITLMGGFAAGTPGDVYLRLIAPILSQSLGVPVVVEARVGATGNLAMEALARAAPDGHMVGLVTSGQLTINPAIFPRMPVDTVQDLAPVMTLFDAPNVLAVSTAQRPGYTDCRAMMAAIRARPGQLNYASSGSGASTHLAAAQFVAATGLDILHVPYRGGPAAMIGLYQGDAEFFFYQTGPVLEDWRAGRVRLLGITAANRVPALPELPTIAEACGLPGFRSSVWWGIALPARTPEPVIARLRTAIGEATATPEIQERVLGMGFTLMPGGAEAMRAAIARDLPRWAAVVKASGARLE